jgi:hypothetical protein
MAPALRKRPRTSAKVSEQSSAASKPTLVAEEKTFLTFPAETRNQIYRDLLPTDYNISFGVRTEEENGEPVWSVFAKKKAEEEDEKTSMSAEKLLSQPLKLPKGIFSTCKQISGEAKGMSRR